jgi:hypothetical protein
MAQWSRFRLSVTGAGALAIVVGALVVPSVTSNAVVPASATASVAPAASVTPASDRITTFAGAGGRSAFEFQPASGDRQAPFGFVSTGGTVQAQPLDGASRTPARATTGAPVRTVRAVAAAATTYKTTLTIDPVDGGSQSPLINLWDRDTWTYVPVKLPLYSNSATAKLPPGHYFVAAIDGLENSYLLTKTFTVSTKAQTVHLAEKAAKPVALKVDDPTARQEGSAVWLSLPNGDLVGFAGGNQNRSYVTTTSLAGTTLRVHDVLTKAGSTAAKPSPYRYDLMKSWPHPLPASPITTIKTASLARTTLTIKAQGITGDGTYQTVPVLGEWTGAYVPTSMPAPAKITEYVTPGVTMSRLFDYDYPHAYRQTFIPPDRSLPAGVSPGETIGAGPLGPNPLAPSTPAWEYSQRSGNTLNLREAGALDDRAGNEGWDGSAASTTTLSSGGEVLRTASGASLQVTVPSTEQTYQLESATARKGPWSQLSTNVNSTWTFASSGPSSGALPLIDLAVTSSGLDQHNRAGAVPVQLSVTPSTRRTSAASTVTAIESSVDDGATWAGLPLTPSGSDVQTSLAVPASAVFVSLRFTASNDQGGTLTRTVIHALAGPASPTNASSGTTTISALKINGGKALIVATPGADVEPRWVTATFTVSDPSGVANAGLIVWHGSRYAPDGLLKADTTCVPSSATTSKCTAEVPIWTPRYSFGKNALAGSWPVEVWASATDGTSFTDRPAAGSLIVKRDTRLTADATPEPVKKGKKITITGSLTRADWAGWTFTAYASRTLTLQWAKAGSSTWTTVKSVKTDAKGKVKTTVKAKADGSFRWTFAGDGASDKVTSSGDSVDVR